MDIRRSEKLDISNGYKFRKLLDEKTSFILQKRFKKIYDVNKKNLKDIILILNFLYYLVDLYGKLEKDSNNNSFIIE